VFTIQKSAQTEKRVDLRVCGTFADLNKADNDDEAERQKLGSGEEVLHSGGRLHAVAVDECEQDCRAGQTQTQGGMKSSYSVFTLNTQPE